MTSRTNTARPSAASSPTSRASCWCAATPLFKLERLLGIDLDHVEADTLAGLVYDTLKRVPEEEEVLDTEGLRIIVKKMRGPKIVLAKVVKLD